MSEAQPAALPSGGRTTGSVMVVYLGGFGRSGSTLLERVLGQVPGTVAAGEVVHLIERGLLRDEDCGCGRAFGDCPFWSDVGIKAFGGWEHVDGEEWLALKRRVDRNRYIPLLLAPVRPRFRADLDQHAERLGALYTAIAEVGGARVVIDSSKQASTAFVLRRVAPIDLRVVHLVRDSRGVAYSWTKEVARPEVRDQSALMPRFHPVGAAARWMSYNALVPCPAGVRHTGDVAALRVLHRRPSAGGGPGHGGDRSSDRRRRPRLPHRRPCRPARRATRSPATPCASAPVASSCGATKRGAAGWRRGTAAWSPRSPRRCSPATATSEVDLMPADAAEHERRSRR